ncbi:MAG: DUF2304 domain-containing protein [Planctomycetota bacterium]
MLSLVFAQGLAMDPQLDSHQKIVAVTLAVATLLVIVELVRRRKLREEFSAIWIGTALILLTMALEPRLLSFFAGLIGAKAPTSALFFGALVFSMLLTLFVTLRLSRITLRSKSLARQTTLTQSELEELRTEVAELRREVTRLQRGGDSTQDGAA